MAEDRNYIDKLGGLFEGLKAGLNDFRLDKPFAAYNKGRDETSQKAWDAYNVYKAAAEVALKEGDIDEEQFNFIKGKAGAHHVTNRYINREDFPLMHHLGANALNVLYQGNQSLFGDQPWWDAITDYMQQDEGVESEEPLGKPWQELDYWIKQNSIK
tara:strand:+ start:463 stop:933 length:471 start_codon:yes stop_codon:yes gene_type:complete